MLNQVDITTLPNGCRIATSRMPHVESISLGLAVAVGGRHEHVAESGHSHFLEHMVFKGTQRRSARQISQAIEGRGGYLNAVTNAENTRFYAKIPTGAEALALDVLADMTLHPRLAEEAVDLERMVILEELAMYRDQPDSHVFDLVNEALWARHPVGRSLLGTQRSLAGTTARSLDAFRQRHYNAGATVFAAAGKIEHDRFVSLVTPYAMELPVGRPSPFRAVTKRTPQQRSIVEHREVEQAQLVLGFRGFGARDPRRHALALLNIIMGGNMSSRLFQTLRERLGLAYEISSSMQLLTDTGALFIGAGLDAARTDKALRHCVTEMRRLRDKPVGKVEFRRARDYVLGQFKIGLESTGSHMGWMVGSILGHGKFQHPSETMERLMTVTPDEVQSVAQELLRPEHASLALILPKNGNIAATRFDELLMKL